MNYLKIIYLTAVLTFLSSCDNNPETPWIGPASSTRGAKNYLRKIGFKDSDFIDRLINRKPLSLEECLKWYKCESTSVRCLVAKNPSTPIDILNILSTDSKLLVKQGVAVNPNIPNNIINKFLQERDWRGRYNYSLLSSLVQNTGLTNKQLLNIHRDFPKLRLTSFLGNRNCPELIREKARKCPPNSLERRWLEIGLDRQKKYEESKLTSK